MCSFLVVVTLQMLYAYTKLLTSVYSSSPCSIFFQSIIDFLKIDIEHNEWDSLHSMNLDGSLTKVKQLAVEFHFAEALTNKPKSDFAHYWNIISGLHNQGFRIWHSHGNLYSPTMTIFEPESVRSCLEIYLLNVNFSD